MAKTDVVVGFHTILIECADMEASLAFWGAGLGIPIGDPDPDGSVTIDLGGVNLTLHPDFRPGKHTTRGAGVHIHLAVADAIACFERLQAAGLEPQGTPTNKPWGCEFGIVDPSGVHLEIVGPRA